MELDGLRVYELHCCVSHPSLLGVKVECPLRIAGVYKERHPDRDPKFTEICWTPIREHEALIPPVLVRLHNGGYLRFSLVPKRYR